MNLLENNPYNVEKKTNEVGESYAICCRKPYRAKQ